MNLQEHIRKVLRESVSPQVRRRHGEFDRIFKHYRKAFINNPYKSFNSLWNTLLEVSLETLYHAWFSKTVSDDDWEESAEYIENYLIKKYKDETLRMWNNRDSINESEEKSGKYTKAIKVIVNDFKNEDFVCDVDVEYYGAADAYIIIVRVDKKEIETYYEKQTIWYATERIREYIGDLYRNIYREVKDYFPVEVSVHITQTKCSKKLNESDESKQERKFTKLLTNIEEFLNSNEYPSVVRLMVDYDEVMDDVIVNIFIDPEHAVKLGGGINSVIKRSGKKIMEDLSALPFDFKYHIHFEKPKLNESEHKKSKLLRVIEEDGLLQVIQDTGLSLPQIYTKTGELPREVFERFIKDFINKEGYHQSNGSVQLGYEVEIQTHVYVDHFYLEGDRITVEIKRLDNRGKHIEGYIESLSNLTDDEIFNIVEDMILWGGEGYY